MDHSTKPTARPRPSAALIWAAMLILYVVWGSTYLGISIAVESIPSFIMAGARFALAGLVMLGAAFVLRRGALNLPSRREWRDSFVVGGLLMGGGMGMVALGEETVPSGIAALIVAMMPLWVAVLGRALFGERLPLGAVVGVGIGLSGVAILVWPSSVAAESFNPGGILALVISPISWSTGSLFSAHRAKLPRDPLVATAAQMLAGSVVLAVMAAVRGELTTFRIESVTTESLAAFGYLAVIGSLVAFTAYVWLLRVAPLPLIATYAYVNPVVAVALGAIVLSEPITPRTLVAGAVIVFAVALIITSRSRMTKVSAAEAARTAAEAARTAADGAPSRAGTAPETA